MCDIIFMNPEKMISERRQTHKPTNVAVFNLKHPECCQVPRKRKND